MPIEIDPEIKQRIAEATQRLTSAERELAAAIAELTVSERSDKRMVSERLRTAMAELVAARTSLAELIESQP